MADQSLPHGPCLPPSPIISSPWIPFIQTQQFGQMPAASRVVCGGCQMWGTVISVAESSELHDA